MLQDTYLRFLGLAASQRQASSERPLLFRMATHILYDHFRRTRREQRFGPPEPARPPTERVPSADLARAFAELTPRERSLLWLAHVEGFSHVEVAEALELRPGSVRVLLFRARATLAAVLRDRGLDPR